MYTTKNYRLIIYPALEVMNRGVEFVLSTKEELSAAYETSAALLLFVQDEMNAMEDFSNMFVQEEIIDGVWVEIDEWDEDINQIIEELKND